MNALDSNFRFNFSTSLIDPMIQKLNEYYSDFINRINTGKSNIYTSNVDGDALRSLLGDRLYSRIISYSDDIEFQGKDLRGVFKNIEKGVDD